MSRFTGPKNKLSRRLSHSVSETGKEFKKGKQEKKLQASTQRKISDYGVHLKEKQKARFIYGVSEKQFFKTYLEAGKIAGIHGENFIKLLESRLDNIVYRIGFASTRPAARQLVNHGHILVDGKKVDIASYRLQPGQKVSLKEASKSLTVVKASLEAKVLRKEFIYFDAEKLEGTFSRYPERNEVLENIKEQLIIEYYSK
ncbi:MAG: 30S ribosomal protein S4 [Acholeplasmatales bacterium]|jgi:small subunit ribosomal protein S4|nr:30S ribosomal protein S4 [Acholeplasmatales bacterium]